MARLPVCLSTCVIVIRLTVSNKNIVYSNVDIKALEQQYDSVMPTEIKLNQWLFKCSVYLYFTKSPYVF